MEHHSDDFSQAAHYVRVYVCFEVWIVFDISRFRFGKEIVSEFGRESGVTERKTTVRRKRTSTTSTRSRHSIEIRQLITEEQASSGTVSKFLLSFSHKLYWIVQCESEPAVAFGFSDEVVWSGISAESGWWLVFAAAFSVCAAIYNQPVFDSALATRLDPRPNDKWYPKWKDYHENRGIWRISSTSKQVILRTVELMSSLSIKTIIFPVTKSHWLVCSNSAIGTIFCRQSMGWSHQEDLTESREPYL